MSTIKVLLSPFMGVWEIKRMATNGDEYMQMTKSHILEVYGPSLTRLEKDAVIKMKRCPKTELPKSLYLRVWERDKVVESIQQNRLLDVRTRVQLLKHLQYPYKSTFGALYQWYIRERYCKTVVAKNPFVMGAILDALAGEGGRDLVISNRYVFKKSIWGFIVCDGPLVVASGDGTTGLVEMVDTIQREIWDLLTNKFVFDVNFALYKDTLRELFG